ncbi:MAG: hypothetical protein Q8N81_04675, partial [bacterium]|nr:hypothetical protein [bacterium]
GILAAVAIFILAMFLYNLFSKSETTPASNESSASSIGDDLLKIHEKLQKVTLDQSFFSSPGYLELTDFSVSIPQQTTGRSNPFNVIGGRD